jgi:hypothetical protein
MTALGRSLEWPPAEFTAEQEAFNRDLLMYRRWVERAPFPGVLPTQAQISPFCDRCALLLDPSMMPEAREAAAGFEKEVVATAARIIGHLGRPPVRKPKSSGRGGPSRARASSAARETASKRGTGPGKRRPRR